MKNNIATNSPSKYFGFDYLRIFFAISIVAWHSKALGATTLYTVPSPQNVTLADVVYGNIFLPGVPIFFLVSIFLYLHNHREKYFLKRILALTAIYFFWNCFSFLLYLPQEKLSEAINLRFWWSGGYGHLWFINVLIFLTIFTELVIYFKKRIPSQYFYPATYFSLIIFTSYTMLKPLIATQFPHIFTSYIKYFSFLDFIYCALFAIVFYFNKGYLDKINPKMFLKIIITLSLVSITFAYFEFFILSQNINDLGFGQYFPSMHRPSVLLITLIIFSVFLRVKKPSPSWVVVLSGLTTGVYLIHFFLLETLVYKYPAYFAALSNNRPLFFLLILASSFVITWFIKTNKLI